MLTRGDVDVAFLDIRMPDHDGLDVVTRAREAGVGATLIVMTAQTTMANAVEAMKRGAYDYLTKPFDLDVVRCSSGARSQTRQLTQRRSTVLKGELRKRYELGVDIIGTSPAMQEIYKLVGRVAKNDATVLIEGESGTGKELIAQGDPLPLAALAGAVRRAQLLGDPARSARERAVRPRARRLHRRDRAARRQASSRPPAARSSSTRSATCRSSCRRSSCACCRSASSSASADARPSAPTCASSPRPTRSSRARCARAASARTSTSA